MRKPNGKSTKLKILFLKFVYIFPTWKNPYSCFLLLLNEITDIENDTENDIYNKNSILKLEIY